MSTPTRPTVFLSYSHRDEDWKDRVVGHLKVLEAELDVWDDRRIAKGDVWLPEIQGAMDRAAVAVLLISKDFLTSRFIKDEEVPHLLKRRREEGLRVIPLFVRHCPWQAVEWLAEIQGGPQDAKPLADHGRSRAEKILSDLALEIRDHLRGEGGGSLSREAGEGRGGGVRLDLGRLPHFLVIAINRCASAAKAATRTTSPTITQMRRPSMPAIQAM